MKRKRTTTIKNAFNIFTTKTAFSRANITWKLIYEDNDGVDYIDLIKSVHAVKSNLIDYQQERRSCKFNMCLHVNFEKAADHTVVTEPPVALVTKQMEMYEHTDIHEVLIICSEQLVNRIEVYEMAVAAGLYPILLN